MPLLVNAENLRPGMVLASNVVNRYSLLMSHGSEMTETDIRQLQAKFPDKQFEICDELDGQIEFEDTSQNYEVSNNARRQAFSLTEKVTRSLQTKKNLSKDEISQLKGEIDKAIDYVQRNPVTAAIVEQSGSWNEYLQEHSASVFYLSLIIAGKLRDYIKQERERMSSAKTLSNAMNLAPLGAAALLHDCGMSDMQQIFKKSEPLNEDEIKAIKNHPIVGAEMLPEDIDPMVKQAIQLHHENMDGSGYPDGLSGEKINVFSRIIRVADAYNAATCAQVYSKAKSPGKALYEMLCGAYRSCYDPLIVQVLAQVVQPFPIGAKLKLNTGQYAVVVKHTSHPYKPIVVIAYDYDGERLSNDKIENPFSLMKTLEIKPVSFAGDDLEFLYKVDKEQVFEDLESREVTELFDLAYP